MSVAKRFSGPAYCSKCNKVVGNILNDGFVARSLSVVAAFLGMVEHVCPAGGHVEDIKFGGLAKVFPNIKEIAPEQRDRLHEAQARERDDDLRNERLGHQCRLPTGGQFGLIDYKCEPCGTSWKWSAPHTSKYGSWISV